MHETAKDNAIRFFNTYVKVLDRPSILEIGSYIGGFNIRSLSPENAQYIGLDIRPGPGVDLVSIDPHTIPYPDNSLDIVISSSCFEHTEYFWALFSDVMRVLKPHGLFYLNAPSNGKVHRFPIDAWRFFPDSGHVLCNWAKYSGYNQCAVVEQYTSNKENDIWNDYVCVAIKNTEYLNIYPKRIIDTFHRYTNGSIYPHDQILNKDEW